MRIWAIYNVPGNAYFAIKFRNGVHSEKCMRATFLKHNLDSLVTTIARSSPDEIRFYGFKEGSKLKRYAKRWIFGQLNPFIHGRLIRKFCSDIEAVIA